MRILNILDKYGDTFPLILADMNRYNNRIRIKNESIAEHSFFVAYNILKIGYDYGLPDDVVNEYVEAMEALFGEGCCYKLRIRPLGGVRVI